MTVIVSVYCIVLCIIIIIIIIIIDMSFVSSDPRLFAFLRVYPPFTFAIRFPFIRSFTFVVTFVGSICCRLPHVCSRSFALSTFVCGLRLFLVCCSSICVCSFTFITLLFVAFGLSLRTVTVPRCTLRVVSSFLRFWDPCTVHVAFGWFPHTFTHLRIGSALVPCGLRYLRLRLFAVHARLSRFVCLPHGLFSFTFVARLFCGLPGWFGLDPFGLSTRLRLYVCLRFTVTHFAFHCLTLLLLLLFPYYIHIVVPYLLLLLLWWCSMMMMVMVMVMMEWWWAVMLLSLIIIIIIIIVIV